MALATSIKFGTQAIRISDGASSPTFAAPCGLTQIGKSSSANTNETIIPYCDDPDKAERLLDEISRSKTLNFSGILSVENLAVWQAWDDAGGPRDVQWFRDLTALNGGGYYQGSSILASFEETGDMGGRYQISGTIEISGAFPWTDAS